MVAFDENRGCEEAAAYYHDFLLDPSDPSIPGPVIDHLGACEHCRGQVRHWGEVLAEAEGEPGRTVADKALIAELQLHFEHLGRPLSCGQVKPLLPGLLIPSLRIRIPTPVTVHVDHCAECAADLATLRGLGLNSEQLTRLTRLYAEISAGDSRTCQKAQSRVGTLGSVSLEDVEDEVLRPLCICRKCRDRAYESRQEWLDGRRDRPDTGDICDSEISIADLFDYVVPNGRAGAEDSRARRQKGTGEHLRSCPRCLEKLQALHRAVYGIADRGDSNVATLYTTKPIDQEVPEDAENLYAGHPINVEVVHRTPDPLGEGSRFASGVRAALGRGFSNPVLRPLIRTAFLVAAMIPLAVVFRMSTRSASGLSIRQVNDIIAGAPAVHVTITYGNGTKPSEEVWISSAQKTFISQTSERTKAYDLQNRRKFLAEPGGG